MMFHVFTFQCRSNGVSCVCVLEQQYRRVQTRVGPVWLYR